MFVATAPNDESFVKDVPTGSVPTERPAPLPTISSSLDANGDGFYTFDELKRAVAALYPSYTWPDKYRIDPGTLLASYAESAARGDLYEVRAEYTIIGLLNLCAWDLAWLDGFRVGDATLMTESLGQLRTVTEQNPMMDGGMRNDLKQIYQRAELGDPAMLQQFVDGSCQSRRALFVSNGSATP